MFVIGLIGGTGLDDWGGTGRAVTHDTPFGPPSGPLLRYPFGDTDLVFLPRHGPAHDIAPHRVNYRANLFALKSEGVDTLLAVNAVGGIRADCLPGELVVPDQLVDYTWGRAHSFNDGACGPLVHIEFSEPYCAHARARLLKALGEARVSALDGGCVAVTQGPRLETAAEIRRMERDGCDLVGMTQLPEAALARELGLSFASLCVVANRAAGKSVDAISEAAIMSTLTAAMKNVRRVVEHFIRG